MRTTVRIGKILCIVCSLMLFTTARTSAQDQSITVTNGLTQIVEQFCLDDGMLFYFPDALGWQVYGIGYWQPMWIDFAEYPSLEKLKSTATATTNQCVLGQPQYGAQPLHVTLTLDLFAGSLVLSPGCSSEELASESAPKGYQAGQWPLDCRVVERLWEQWQTVQKDPDWQEWHGKDARPFITFHFQVADLNEKKTYDDNVAAEEAAWEEWLKAGGDTMDSGAGGGMMLLSGGDCNGCPVIETNAFNICSVNYDASNATSTVTWESCNTHFYDVFSTEELSFNTQWNFRTNLLGQVSSTAWTDYDDLGALTSRFYRVARLASRGDPDGDGLSNGSEASWGTNPYNNDSNGDGILDGPYNNTTPAAWTNLFSSLSGVPGAYLANTNRWFALDPAIPTAAPFKTVNVQTNIYANGDSTNEVFEVSSRGRTLPYAAGSNAAATFGRIDGGIYFNHDATNLYVGVAGCNVDGGNALLIFLDTDSGSGGVTNMTNFVTSIGPKALAQARNLSFTNYFTPNVGIILGSRRGDGRNSNNLVVNGRMLGQGVYTLTNGNQVTDFPGFNPTGGCLISQWGDAGDDAAYAGIQVGISKQALGLTGTNKIFRAAAIFCGGPDGTRGYFSREAYGQSVSGGIDQFGNFGVSNVVLVGSLVSLADNPAPSYAPVTVSDSAVMMQGFFWDVPASSGSTGRWYNVVASNALDLARSGFTAIWLPPPQKSRFGADDVGYAPYDHYDLGQYFQLFTTATRYGTLGELTNATAALSAQGIAPYVDIVMNHMRGDTSGNAPGYYTNYVSGYFYKTPADFYATNDLSSPPFHQLTSFGSEYNEVNQTAPHMRLGLEAWGEWLTGKVGYQGYRFDHAPGIEPWYQAEWLSMPMMSNKFTVLEYIGDVPATRRFLQTWINLVDQRASLFDFMLHNNYLVPMCGAGSFNMASLTNAGLVAVAPEFAVTYVENHDTIRPCFDGQLGIATNKALAYAYILTSDGYPSVFWHDYYYSPNANTNANPCDLFSTDPNDGYVGAPLKPRIDQLISARKRFASGSTTFLPQALGNQQDVYVVKRNGGGPSSKPGCILVINRATTNVIVKVGTGWAANTNVVDYVGNITNLTTDASSNLTFTALATNYAVLVRQPQQALDIAKFANGYGAGTWTNNSNGGWGFAAWTLRATGVIGSSTNGFKIASPKGNAFGTSPGFDTGNNWGIYASGGNTGVAYRAFSSALPVGSTFVIDVDNGFIDTGRSVGFVLRNGNASSSTTDYTTGSRFQFYFVGGGANYTLLDSAGAQDTGIPYTGTGLHLAFTLTSADTYTLVVTDNATGTATTFSGTLAGSGTLDSIALFNNNAGSGSSFDAFFNSLEVKP